MSKELSADVVGFDPLPVLYGRAFDAVRVPAGLDLDLDDLASVESNLPEIMLYEVKSTNRAI
jgi:hypothetical protein